VSSGGARVIAVTGKGGVGKSTTAALIVGWLKRNATGAILALDADPAANLGTLLGIPVEMSIGELREQILGEMKDFPAGMNKENYVEAGLHQAIEEAEKVDLITMGRGEGPGCYCYVNNLLRKFADELVPSYEWMVMDNEAGLEHLSRRTASRIDDLVVVVSESPLAVDCARRIDTMLAGMKRDVRRRHYLLNAVRPDRIDAMRERLEGTGLEYLGAVPRDDAVDEAVFRGEALTALDDGPAVRAIDEVMHRIEGEA